MGKGKFSYITLLLLVTAAILVGCQELHDFKIEVLDAQMFDLSDEVKSYRYHSIRRCVVMDMMEVREANNYVIYNNPLHGLTYNTYEKFGIRINLNLHYTAADERVWFRDNKGKKVRENWWGGRLQESLRRSISINGMKYGEYEKARIDISSAFGKKPVIIPYVEIGEWDKDKRTVNCTVYGVVNMQLLENFNLTVNRKDMTVWDGGDYAPETKDYVEEVKFSRKNLHIPDYSSMDNFISSLAGNTVKRCFKADSVKNLFVNFKPSNPQKGNYILVYKGLDFLYAKTFEFENDFLKCAVDVNQAQLLINVSYSSKVNENVGWYSNGVFQHYDMAKTLEVRVTDLTKGKDVFKKKYGNLTGLPTANSLVQEILEINK